MLYKSVLLTMNTSGPPTPWLHQECYNEHLPTHPSCVYFSESKALCEFLWMKLLNYRPSSTFVCVNVCIDMNALVWACACETQRWMLGAFFNHFPPYFSLFLLSMRMCIIWVCLCSCLHVSGYTCVCVHMEATGWCQKFSLFTLLPYFEAGYLSQSESFSNHGSLLASVL